jgi:UDP-N-acetylglucosamine acyltransferase
VSLELPVRLARVLHRYPSCLLDAVAEHEPGARLVAYKNVTVGEEYFQGHFPGMPVMPGVLMIEALTQAAGIVLLERTGAPATSRVALRGVNDAKFRRQVVPGDQLRIDVRLDRVRSRLGTATAVAYLGEQVVVEARLLLAVEAGAFIPSAAIGAGTTVAANCVIGPDDTVGADCRIDAGVVIDGHTSIGDGTHIYPMASVGLAPQDLKYRGEPTRLTIGRRNVIREFATLNRGTVQGGGETRIGDDNLLMAYVHVAHDCHVGSRTIFGPHATLGGHVTVEDFANISAGSAVHQFCRVGQYAFIGGYSVVTKDAPPYARTVGSRPARVFGVNSIGLARRGFTPDAIAQLKLAYRYLLQSKLNTSQALAQIEQDAALSAAEVGRLVAFIRGSKRGVILRRPTRRVEELVADE